MPVLCRASRVVVQVAHRPPDPAIGSRTSVASIKVIQGPDKGRNFELRGGDNIIGRQGSHVQLSDRTITRQHSHMWHQNGRWLLEDLGSANGTFLNGVKLVTPAPVKRGDQIRCGSSLLVFGGESMQPTIHVDDDGNLVDAAIVMIENAHKHIERWPRFFSSALSYV